MVYNVYNTHECNLQKAGQENFEKKRLFCFHYKFFKIENYLGAKIEAIEGVKASEGGSIVLWYHNHWNTISQIMSP